MELCNDYRPLFIGRLIPHNDELKLITFDDECYINYGDLTEIWKTIEKCDGDKPICQIVDELSTDLSRDTVYKIISDFIILGAVVDSRCLCDVFHSISSNPQRFPSFISDEAVQKNHDSPRMGVKNGKVIQLDSPSDTNTFEILKQRRSYRSYESSALSLSQLGQILNAGYGRFNGHFSVPSGGGLYPLKIYVIVWNNQIDFSLGLYEFDNEKNQLILYDSSPDFQGLSYALNSIGSPFGAPVTIIVASDKNRQAIKYANMSYKLTLLEAGAVAQNITIQATELGLGTCEICALQDKEICKELNITNQISLLAISLGIPCIGNEPDIWSSVSYLKRTLLGSYLPVKSLKEVKYTENFGQKYHQYIALDSSGQVSKGISTHEGQAIIKALAESYERTIAHNLRWDKHCIEDELDAEFITADDIFPYSEEQYDFFSSIKKYNKYHSIQWIKSFYYTSGREVYLPVEAFFYPVDEGIIGRKPAIKTSSSGYAAHNCIEKAIESATLELIERDCLMRTWLNKTSPIIIDDIFLPTYLKNRKKYWNLKGRKVTFLDISNYGIKTFLVTIVGKEYPCFVSGASSSFDSEDKASIIKAFEEAESRLIYGINFPTTTKIRPNEVKNVLDHELLYAQSIEYHEHLDFLFRGGINENVNSVISEFHDLADKLDLVVTDLTPKNSPLCVVKVFSKHLIPISFGYGNECYKHVSLSDISKPIIPHFFA